MSPSANYVATPIDLHTVKTKRGSSSCGCWKHQALLGAPRLRLLPHPRDTDPASDGPWEYEIIREEVEGRTCPASIGAMRKTQPSSTALGTAAVRAIETERPTAERICTDPFARRFTTPWSIT
jgi:hypothetical protein